MLKPLTKLARIESGIEEYIKGKAYAFVAVLGDHTRPFGLGIATANEQGYTPVPLSRCSGDSWDEMAEHAGVLNDLDGIDADRSFKIVCSTMRGKPFKEGE